MCSGNKTCYVTRIHVCTELDKTKDFFLNRKKACLLVITRKSILLFIFKIKIHSDLTHGILT